MFKKITITATTLFAILALSLACQAPDNSMNSTNLSSAKLEGLQHAYFASGCFWCVEAIYESVKGVEEVYNGYSGGHSKNPTYPESNTGLTGHAEAVHVVYDSTKVSFKDLVDVYYGSQDIEQVNGQGPDRGSQYRSIIFYQTEAQKNTIDEKINQLTQQGYKVASEIMSFEKFWMGEDYHQNYERLHPNQGYIVRVSIPRLQHFQKQFPHLLKKQHH